MKTIIITGASSGLGAALAEQYAAENNLFLFGRNKTALEKINKKCKEQGAYRVTNIICDVKNELELKAHIEKIGNEYNIDYVFANAGISENSLKNSQNYLDVEKEIINVNFNGTLNTILPAIEIMKKQKSGHIILISSIAGLIAMPQAAAYATSKAAVKFYGEALSAQLKPYDINVSIVIPGFIKTAMTDANNFKMPLMIDAKTAAEKIYKAVARKRKDIIFPKRLYFAVKFLNHLPKSIFNIILNKANLN